MKTKQCDCMEKLIEGIKDRYPDKHHDLEVPKLLNFTTGKIQYYLNMTYRKKRKNGELTNKKFDLPIVFSHCPFCGKGYPKDKP